MVRTAAVVSLGAVALILAGCPKGPQAEPKGSHAEPQGAAEKLPADSARSRLDRPWVERAPKKFGKLGLANGSGEGATRLLEVLSGCLGRDAEGARLEGRPRSEGDALIATIEVVWASGDSLRLVSTVSKSGHQKTVIEPADAGSPKLVSAVGAYWDWFAEQIGGRHRAGGTPRVTSGWSFRVAKSVSRRDLGRRQAPDDVAFSSRLGRALLSKMAPNGRHQGTEISTTLKGKRHLVLAVSIWWTPADGGDEQVAVLQLDGNSDGDTQAQVVSGPKEATAEALVEAARPFWAELSAYADADDAERAEQRKKTAGGKDTRGMLGN